MRDVLAINLDTNKVRFLATNKDQRNADAIVSLAIIRRGVEEEIYGDVEAGSYKEGDEWIGPKTPTSPEA